MPTTTAGKLTNREVFGVKNTASRNKSEFQEYDMMARDSKLTVHALLWSEKTDGGGEIGSEND